ncbi:hypothetical protein SLA2020_506940 [Shorea laevis]
MQNVRQNIRHQRGEGIRRSTDSRHGTRCHGSAGPLLLPAKEPCLAVAFLSPRVLSNAATLNCSLFFRRQPPRAPKKRALDHSSSHEKYLPHFFDFKLKNRQLASRFAATHSGAALKAEFQFLSS